MDMIRLLDENLNKTDKLVPKEDISKYTDYYHTSVELWIINSKKELLLVKNVWNFSKRYPGLFTCLGTNMVNDETVDEALDRIDGKIGVKLYKNNIIKLPPVKVEKHHYAYITCILYEDINEEEMDLSNNFSHYKFVDKDELINMCNNGEISYFLVSRIKDQIVNYMK